VNLPDPSPASPPDPRSLSFEELSQLVLAAGERPFRVRQVFRWLHQRWATSWSEMPDLPQAFRARLAEEHPLSALQADQVQQASDGTTKFRFRTADGQGVESVYMPEEKRHTLCVSTQAGCAMGCAFCMTATMGLVRHLGAGEIVDQVHRVNARLFAQGMKGPRPLTNLVFMGMGEPLHNFDNLKRALELLQHADGPNFSHRHITVSTSGLVPGIARLGAETEVKLAVSLNATTDEVRDRLMPVNRRWNIAALLDACRKFPLRQGRRVTFEYVLLRDVNDSLDDARRLADLLADLPSKVNLIPYNENPGLPFKSVDERQVERFRDLLIGRNVTVVTRKSRGRDIAAACGQLVAKAAP